MAKLKAALTAVEDKLGLNERLLGKARRRHKKFRERAEANHAKQLKAQAAADKALTFGPNEDQAKGARLLKKAARCEHRAIRDRTKALYWKGRIKAEVRRVKKLKVDKESIAVEVAKLGATVRGNEVKGGTPKERWLLFWLTAVNNCAHGIRRNFYSMEGAWDILRELVGGPEFGHRSDCSSTVTGAVKAVGLPDINGTRFTGGYTGTFLQQNNGWKIVSEAAMRKKGWGVVVYLRFPGDTIGHHTEAFTPTASEPDLTSGHGSQPVDHGTVDLFGDGLYVCMTHNK